MNGFTFVERADCLGQLQIPQCACDLIPQLFGVREIGYQEAGIPGPFVQDNHSRSLRSVLRGLHYQLHHPQGKLVYVARGEIFDVAVDIRLGSPTFGKWCGATLSDENHKQLYIPSGFAHGFQALSPLADVIYKCTGYYQPEDERGVSWNDVDIAIQWPIPDPLVSDKDQQFPSLAKQHHDSLPKY